MEELKPCPFCGGKARLRFKDIQLVGVNGFGDRKNIYRVQVICNKCHSRGKPIKTDPLINCNPWLSVWGHPYCRKEYANNKTIQTQTELVRQWAEKAIEAWNKRANNGD